MIEGPMRLADFIEANTDEILSEWESFARTLLPAAGGLDVGALRDHAQQILETIALDLRTGQGRAEQSAKSRGQALRSPDSPETAAETHAVLRATGGFTMQQMVAEYRALRASVLKLWADAHEPGPATLADMTRFNEAIDQAVAESVDFFAVETERWRNVFLGVLGHDLRGPLNAILLTSKLLVKMSDGTPTSEATARLIRGGERMKQLLDDLLDYSRVSLDLGIPVAPASMDLAVACQEEIELQRIAWPDHTIELTSEGPMEGVWDASRLKQVLGNLIANAAKYGDRGAPINVRLVGSDGEVILSVEDTGPAIAGPSMQLLFEPLWRGAHADPLTERTSLGLGLFIVRQIVHAHGGTVTVSSSDGKTVFNVTLPRRPRLEGRQH
jgi:signal transduction histidine kinase